MVAMQAANATIQYIKNPVDQAKDTLLAGLDALDKFSKGVDPKRIAGDFVKSMEQIWDLNQDPNAIRLAGVAGKAGVSFGSATAALGLYAKVFTAGLEIAYGAEPSTVLNNNFKSALHDLTQPQAPTGFSRPWDALRNL